MPTPVLEFAGLACAPGARFSRHAWLALTGAAMLALGACGGGGTPDPAAPVIAPPPVILKATLTGVAAIGAPLVNATVSASCISGPVTVSLPTSANGSWTLEVPANTLPCALEAAGGLILGAANTLTLHSLARAEGRVNLTPLTDLAIARAAGQVPSAWFAALGNARAGARLDAAAASSQLLAALTAAGYTVPSNGFDPFTTAFEAKAGDPVDGLLDAIKAALANTHKTYGDLIADLVASANSTLHLPPAFTDPKPPQTGGIVLTSKSSATAADIAPLVGTYQGNMGRVFTPGQPTLDTTSCTITVTADGMMNVAAGGRSIQADVNGDVGDLILNVVSLTRIMASDVPHNTYAQLTTVRGVLAESVARNGGTGFTTADDRVECLIANPNITSAGTVMVSKLGGATAADIGPKFIGTFSNGTCTLTVSNKGVMHLTTGSVDLTTTLAGDQNDTTWTNDGVGGAVDAHDYFAGGLEKIISIGYNPGNVAAGFPENFFVNANASGRYGPSEIACRDMAKQ